MLLFRRMSLIAIRSIFIALMFAAALELGRTFRAQPVFAELQRATSTPAETRAMQKLRDASQLRPATNSDRVLAEFFDRGGEPLLKEENVIVPVESEVPVVPPDPGDAPAPAVDRLLTVVCAHDAIVVGQAVSSRAILNKSESFLVTIYELAVADWVRPSGGPRSIHVAMLGGRVQVDDTTLSSTALPLLEMSSPVLLFLKRISGIDQIYALKTTPVRLQDGAFVAEDFPSYVPKGVRDDRSVSRVLGRLREKQLTCGAAK
jgi:hypothetical protein